MCCCAVTVSFGQTSDGSILKRLSIEELMNVEVTSVSRRPERLFDTASAIQVITREEIRRSGATSIPEALRLAPNLEVAQISAREWAISARGFNSATANKLLVLIDGRTVYTPLYAGVFWDVQDTLLEDVERIEVISGPGASVWGANAVNGVINIITRPAKDTHGVLLEAGGGSELRGSGGIRYGDHVGNFDFRIYGKYFDRGASVLPSGADARDGWQIGQMGLRAELKTSPSAVLTVQGDIYDGRAGQQNAGEIGLGGGNVIARWERTVSEDSDVKLQFYYDRSNRRVAGGFSEGLDTYDLDLQHRFPVGERHELIWGLAYRLIEDDTLGSANVAFTPPHVSRQWFSGFLQDEIALIKDRLHFAVGTKLGHNDYTGVELQPTGRLVWKIAPRQSLWGAVSHAVRTPSRIDRESRIPGQPPFLVSGNPNFGNEELMAYELGYRAQIRSRTSVSIATYLNDYDDIRSLERVAPGQASPFPAIIGNGLAATARGAELAVDYQLKPGLRFRAGYSPLHIHFSRHPASTDLSNGTILARDSDHHFLFRSSADLPRHFEFDSTFRYVSEIASQSLPGYAELDGRLGWHPGSGFEISLVGKNLLHPHHAEFGIVATRREIERSIGFNVLWSF
jgi:iron complex outermembrane receptor protein